MQAFTNFRRVRETTRAYYLSCITWGSVPGNSGEIVMRIGEILKQGSFPGTVIAGLWASWTDSIRELPVVGGRISDLSAELDTFIFMETKNATGAILFLGMLIAWLIYFSVSILYLGRRKRARLKLAHLRTEGVSIKNEGLHLDDTAFVPKWIAKIRPWTDRVIETVKKIDEADAQQYETMDTPGEPRTWPRFNLENEDHVNNYIWLDRRLVSLDALITKYGEKL